MTKDVNLEGFWEGLDLLFAEKKSSTELDLQTHREQELTSSRLETAATADCLVEVQTPQIKQAKEQTRLESSAPKVAAQQASSAVFSEIKQLRYKYIIGKLAGEDLVAGSGQLIAAKNAVITADIVDKAEKEAKLAELIVNMTIPGLEESI